MYISSLTSNISYKVKHKKQRKCSRYYYSDKISLNYHFISLMISTIYYLLSLQLSWIWGKVGNYYNKIQHTTIIKYYYDCPSPPPSFLFFLFDLVDSWPLIRSICQELCTTAYRCGFLLKFWLLIFIVSFMSIVL